MSRDLVGAAARFTRPIRGSKADTVDQSWQTIAWDYYSTTPEVRFVANWVGNAMSGARLFAGRRANKGAIEAAPEDHPAARLVEGIAGGPDGQSQMLRAFGPHLVVPGEGWIVIRPTETGEDWRVLSVLELTKKSGNLEAEIDGQIVKIPGFEPDQTPPEDAPIAIRVWDPHPRKHLEADSPVRASLGLLEELQLLNAAVKAIARSRLTGRGVLLVPKGTRFPTKPGAGDSDDDLIELFMQVAETAYKEPESAAATVPIVLEVPPDTISDIKRLTFESEFDTLAVQLREEAIRRFATGMDIPAEILLGLGDANHWSAWTLQAEAIRLGVEPRLATFTHALTTQWLQPALELDGVDDAQEWLVWSDTSQLRVQANRSQTALEVYDRGAISAEALRRETGFDEEDAPADAPESANDNEDDPDDSQDQDQAGDDQAQEGDDVTAKPRLPVDETTNPPDTLPASLVAPDGLLAAADGLIYNALHRAGEKLRRTPACPRSRRSEANQITAAALHTLLPVDLTQVDQWGLLDDAFDRTDEIAARYGADGACLRASLDTYCRELLAAGQPHVFDYVAAVLSDCLQEDVRAGS